MFFRESNVEDVGEIAVGARLKSDHLFLVVVVGLKCLRDFGDVLPLFVQVARTKEFEVEQRGADFSLVALHLVQIDLVILVHKQTYLEVAKMPDLRELC